MRLRRRRDWLVRLCGLFHHQRREREFAEELASHLALRIKHSPADRRGVSRLVLAQAASGKGQSDDCFGI